MNARYDSKPLRVVAKVRTKTDDSTTGYLTQKGLRRLQKEGDRMVDVYFAERRSRGYTFMIVLCLISSSLEYVGELTSGQGPNT